MKATYKRRAFLLDEDILIEGYTDKYGFHPNPAIQCEFGIQKFSKKDIGKIIFYNVNMIPDNIPCIFIDDISYYSIQEIRFEYKNFPCVVLMNVLGYRTGYVGIQKNHIYYQCSYQNIPISCHGGLTYADNNLIGQTDKNIWWIGYDTGHGLDGRDFESAERLFQGYPISLLHIKKTKKIFEEFSFIPKQKLKACTLKYCIEECKSIVDQLINENKGENKDGQDQTNERINTNNK